MKYSHGLEYKVSKSGVAVLCGIGNCTDEHLIIPSFVEDFPIVGVAEKAFARCLQIKSISLPSSVTYVSDQAFAWCRNIEEVRFETVSEVGNRAFMGCDKLSCISFGNKLETIGDKAFAYCPSLSSVSLPDSLTSLGSASFEGCRNLVSITISSGISIIENGTFYACESLSQISLPKTLEYIDEYAFAYCASINEMNIPTKTVINRDAFFECSLNKNGKAS